jgi:pyruvate dehydrogenase E1 component beta subunit
MRKLSYSLAINEALHQMMDSDPSVFLIGQGVKSPYVRIQPGASEKFGPRVIDTPVSENAIRDSRGRSLGSS